MCVCVALHYLKREIFIYYQVFLCLVLQVGDVTMCASETQRDQIRERRAGSEGDGEEKEAQETQRA